MLSCKTCLPEQARWGLALAPRLRTQAAGDWSLSCRVRLLLVKHMRQLMLDFTIRTFKPEDVAQKPGRTAHGVDLTEPGGRARTQRVAGTKAGERGR